jgi:hypothetical protein
MSIPMNRLHIRFATAHVVAGSGEGIGDYLAGKSTAAPNV